MNAKGTRKAAAAMPDNAKARKAMETIDQIEAEAQQKKMAQLESLQTAKANIMERLDELNHQLEQINNAIGSIKGEKVGGPPKEKRIRRNLEGERDRVARWMEGHKGERFGAGDLTREFPELEGTPISIFLKPLVESGKIKTDTTEGIRRTKYFIEA